MTEGKISLKKQTIYLIVYNLEDSDKEELRASIKNATGFDAVFDQKDKLINLIERDKFTEPQKLLVTIYLHLYALLHNRDIINDIRLKKIRDVLCISEQFTGVLYEYFKKIDTPKILNNKTPVACILEPSPKIRSWVTETVFQSIEQGGCTDKVIIDGLSPKEYEHELDRKAIESLKGTPGLETAVKMFYEHGIERLVKIRYTGSNIKVSKESFPQLYGALETACKVLNVNQIPDLYIEMGFINAFTTGVKNPVIVLSSGCVGLLSYDELLFVLGHEIGHIKSQHVLYHEMASVLPILGDIAGSLTLGMGGIMATGIEVALLNWQRKSEFTSDRAGLLTCQNIKAATTAMMKIAGAPPRYYKTLNPEDFEKQAREFEGFDFNTLDKIAKTVSVMFQGHPWTVMRGHELYKWIDSGEYKKVLGRSTKQSLHTSGRQAQDSSISGNRFCTNCGSKLNWNEKYCVGCGSPVNTSN